MSNHPAEGALITDYSLLIVEGNQHSGGFAYFTHRSHHGSLFQRMTG
jgi:hypothetical protein